MDLTLQDIENSSISSDSPSSLRSRNSVSPQNNNSRGNNYIISPRNNNYIDSPTNTNNNNNNSGVIYSRVDEINQDLNPNYMNNIQEDELNSLEEGTNRISEDDIEIDKTCLICMEDNMDTNSILVFSNNCDCQKFYHISCFLEWYLQNKSCPICHQTLSQSCVSIFIHNHQLKDWEEISLAALINIISNCDDINNYNITNIVRRVRRQTRSEMRSEMEERLRVIENEYEDMNIRCSFCRILGITFYCIFLPILVIYTFFVPK